MLTTKGTSAVQENWQHFDEGKPRVGMSEARLYTDVPITGHVIDLGPYSFLNPIAQPSARTRMVAGIVVRASFHVPQGESPSSMKDNFDHYHGGDHFDEIAALLSLFMGIRLKAGNVDRVFWDNDPLGRPLSSSYKAEPQLTFAERPQIPSLQRTGALGETSNLVALDGLQHLSKARRDDTVAFVKAARLYQEAVWIADAEPELAWLLLVASVESVAVEWAHDDAPEERLRDGIPNVAAFLESRLNAEAFSEVARLLARYTGVTRKFAQFLRHFAPPAPPTRPLAWRQFTYDADSIEAAAKSIYRHRSNYLHAGTAIPLPMCEAPTIMFPKEGDSYGEIPMGLATQSRGAQWTISSTPMLLHMFEHLAQGAILAWWRSRR
jgi:hypothetical protein